MLFVPDKPKLRERLDNAFYVRKVADEPFVEYEKRMTRALPFMDSTTRSFYAEANFKKTAMTSQYDEDFNDRAQLLIGMYYGTRQSLREVAGIFQLKPSEAYEAMERYILSIWEFNSRLYPDGRGPISERYPLESLSLRKQKNPDFVLPSIGVAGEIVKMPEDVFYYHMDYVRPEGREVFRMLDEGQAVIVEGPHGIGKTEYLYESVRQEAEMNGYTVKIADMRLFDAGADTELAERKDELAVAEGNRLLVIDEAQSIIMEDVGVFRAGSEQILANLFSWAKDTNTRLMFIVAGAFKDDRTEVISRIESIAASKEIDTTPHSMRTKHIPVDLVEKWLKVTGAKPELIDFLTNPENRALLTPRMFGIFMFHDGKVHTVGDLARYVLKDQIHTTFAAGSIHFAFAENYEGGSIEDIKTLYSNLGLSTKHLDSLPAF